MRCIIYHQFGYQNCLETLILLSIKEFESKNSLNRDSLKAGYKAFLSQIQPLIPMNNSLEIEFVDDCEKSQKLAYCFNVNLEQEGIDQLISNDSTIENPIVRIQEHLERLGKFDPDLYSLFSLAINTIFCGGSAHAVGGTTSAAIGVVWGNPEKKWKICDYFEYFVHELTHTLMFLDELRFQHYKNLEMMYDQKNFSLSAILQADRPIDRVLHSIVVATEILMLRSRNLIDCSESQIHPSTDQLIESTQISIDKLLSHSNKDRILTSRSLKIIEVCQNSISQHIVLKSSV